MTKKFEEKIQNLRVVDTRKYRYQIVDDGILRIELDCLGTTAALDRKSEYNPFGWELIKKF